MKKFFLLFLVLVAWHFGSTQKPVEVWQVIKEKNSDNDSIRCLVRMDKRGVLALDKLPDILELHFKTLDAIESAIQFNEGKDSFAVSLTESGSGMANVSDLDGNILRLTFLGQYLTGIGNRVIRGKNINTKKIFLRIVDLPSKTEKVSELSPMEKLGKARGLNCFVPFDSSHLDREKFFCRTVNCCNKDDLNPPDPMSPEFWNTNVTNKVTPKYRLIYDARKGIKTDLMLLRFNGRNNRYEVSHMLFPKASRIMSVSVIGYRDSIYSIDSSSRQLNLDSDSSFLQAYKALGSLTTSATAPPIGVKTDDRLVESSTATKIKEQFLSLERAIERFNFVYSDINFREDDYSKDLLCLKLKIKTVFGIGMNNNANDLSNQFAAYVLDLLNATDTCFYSELHSLIEKIAEQYQIAVNKESNISLFTKSVPVPDHDILKIGINGGGVKYEQEFHTSLGFKVDASVGVFVTGLKDQNFVFVDSTVKYRRDSSGYTPTSGPLFDTTGRIVIHENNSYSRVGIGVLLHGYPRISGNYNLGLSVGFLTTTNIDLNVMGGLSLILGNNQRFILSGGLIWGKATRMSSSVKEGMNRLTSGVTKPEDLTYAKPIFYNTQNSVVPTVNDFERSWFIGFTWNLSK
jgi:hypothetical protein